MKILNTFALAIGGFLTIAGILGVIVRIVPSYDGEVAITGAVLFAAGLISNAIISQK